MPTPTMDPYKPVIRWTYWRKQLLCEAYAAGKISAEDIHLIHGISLDELNEMQRRNGAGGVQGRNRLRSTDREALATRPIAVVPNRPPEPPPRPKPPRKMVRKKKAIDIRKPQAELKQPVDAELPKLPPNTYQVRVARAKEPDLVFDFSGPASRQRMASWLDMYKTNASHNDNIIAVTAIGSGGRLIAEWRR